MLEWVQDHYDANYYREGNNTSEANLDDSLTTKILRGGSWYNSAEDIRSTKRFSMNPRLPQDLNNPNNLVYAGTGFRCAQDAN
jgi:formylglycine-generating enzyme required for sulfatase activity